MGRPDALYMPNLEVLCRTSISKGELAYPYSQQVVSSISMQALGEGPRQRRRMDAAEPLNLSEVCRLIV